MNRNYTLLFKEQGKALKNLYIKSCNYYDSLMFFFGSNIDYFWNFVVTDQENLISKYNLDYIENEFLKNNRIPCIYLIKGYKNYNQNNSMLIQNKYMLKNQQVFMELKENHYPNIPQNLVYKMVDNKLQIKDYMEVFYNVLEKDYSLGKEFAQNSYDFYKDSIINSIGHYNIKNIIIYEQDEPVCVASLCEGDEYSFIYNLKTKINQQNKGYGKNMMKILIDLFNNSNNKKLLLYTKAGGKNEKWYIKYGFKVIFYADQFLKANK